MCGITWCCAQCCRFNTFPFRKLWSNSLQDEADIAVPRQKPSSREKAAIPTVDVMRMAKEAVEANTADWVQTECVQLPTRLPKVREVLTARDEQLMVSESHCQRFTAFLICCVTI